MNDRYFRINQWRDEGEPITEAEALAILSERSKELAIGPGDHETYYRGGSIIVQYNEFKAAWNLLGRDNQTLASVPTDVYSPKVVLATAREILKKTLTHTHALVLK
jgi:hypothetical protein